MVRSQEDPRQRIWFADDGAHKGNRFTETSDHDHNGKTQQSTDHGRSIIDHALLAYWLIGWKT
jgi:hypothetical protein